MSVLGKGSFIHIYHLLYEKYGPQHWWPADDAFEMIMGAILTQNTNWKNVEKALVNLKPFMEPYRIEKLSLNELAELIRPSGYYNIKAERIKNFLKWFKRYDYNFTNLKEKNRQDLRKELLNIKGIGKETADVIILYALNKEAFIVDAYAHRLFYRLGFDMPHSYDDFQEVVERELPKDVQLFNEFHALIVEHGKVHCKAQPICEECPLLPICSRRLK